MGSLQAEDEAKQELNDSGLGQDESIPAKKEISMDPGEGIQLLDLSDDALLYILRYCTPQDLKALGYTCSRLGSLVLDRTLWERVDARSTPVGVQRMRWFLQHGFSSSTSAVLLSGYAKNAERCHSNLNVRTTDSEDCPKCTSESRSGPKNDEQNEITERRVRRGVIRSGPVVQIYETMPTDSNYPSMQFRMRNMSNEVEEKVPADKDCPGPQFTLTRPALIAMKTQCPQLTSLALEYCNLNCMKITISDFPSTLKKLSLRGSRCFNQAMEKTFLFKIQDSLKVLEELDVSECDWVEPSSLLPLSKLPALQCLYMRSCHKMSECVAYSSLATRYGFNKLRVIDLRESPVGDSEVSSFGWVPSLEELYVSPAPEKQDLALHGHITSDQLPKHRELDPWEEQEPDYYTSKCSKTSKNTYEDDSEDVSQDANPLYMKRKRNICSCKSVNAVNESSGNPLSQLSNEVPEENEGVEPKRARQNGTDGEAGPSGSQPCLEGVPKAEKLHKAIQNGENDDAGPSKSPPSAAEDQSDVKKKRTRKNSTEKGVGPFESPPCHEEAQDGMKKKRTRRNGADDEAGPSKSPPPVGKDHMDSKPKRTRRNESDDEAGSSKSPPSVGQNNMDSKPKRTRRNGADDEAGPSKSPPPVGQDNTDLKPKRTRRNGADDEPGPSKSPQPVGQDNTDSKPKRTRRNGADDEAGPSKSPPPVGQDNTDSKPKRTRRNGADDEAGPSKSPPPVGQDNTDSKPKRTRRNGADDEAGPSKSPPPVGQDNTDSKPKRTRRNGADDEAGPSKSPPPAGQDNTDSKPKRTRRSGFGFPVGRSRALPCVPTGHIGIKVNNSGNNNGEEDYSFSVFPFTLPEEFMDERPRRVRRTIANNRVEPSNSPPRVEDDDNGVKPKRTRRNKDDSKASCSESPPCVGEDQKDAKPKRTRRNGADDGAGPSNSPPVFEEDHDDVKKKRTRKNGNDDGDGPSKSPPPEEDKDGVKKKRTRKNKDDDGAGPSKSPPGSSGSGEDNNGEKEKKKKKKSRKNRRDGAGPSRSPTYEEEIIYLNESSGAEEPPEADADEPSDEEGPGALVAKLVCFRQSREPVIVEGEDGERQEVTHHGPVHQRLFVNVRRQLHVMYRLTMPVYPVSDEDSGDAPARRLDVTSGPYTPTRFDPAMLVSDTAVHRFGRAETDSVNYINIGVNGIQRDVNRGRPDRSNLRVLSITGFRNITNRSLVHLVTAAPNLRLVDFTDTRVTERGVENFRSLRPDCEVIYRTCEQRKET